ncbi:Mov34/MPN/PAD-1 family protein [Moorena producens]|uniref:Mov34/MPN/PAD-1 family protein n=1 Tax=Moorena producens TaxID=1155739 RepID=UPI003C70A363
MGLTLDTQHQLAIQNHAESTYPEECCGLLLGKHRGEVKTLVEVLPTPNNWDSEAADAYATVEGKPQGDYSRQRRFSIAPEVLLRAQKDARDRNLDIIGIYHSHPDHPAVPSEFDRAIAWQQYSYIIVAVEEGKACDFRSWSLDEHHQFQPEETIIIKG